MGAKSQAWALSTQREDAPGPDLPPIFEDFSQFEKLSKIKLHLYQRFLTFEIHFRFIEFFLLILSTAKWIGFSVK